jgi:hypothetical protein
MRSRITYRAVLWDRIQPRLSWARCRYDSPCTPWRWSSSRGVLEVHAVSRHRPNKTSVSVPPLLGEGYCCLFMASCSCCLLGSGEKENDKAKKSILALRGGGYQARYYACSEVCDDLLKCFYFANKVTAFSSCFSAKQEEKETLQQLFQRKMALHRTLESPAKSEEEIFL